MVGVVPSHRGLRFMPMRRAVCGQEVGFPNGLSVSGMQAPRIADPFQLQAPVFLRRRRTARKSGSPNNTPFAWFSSAILGAN